MSPAHDQQWREQTLSTHVRHGRYCAACGQSWPCTEYDAATDGAHRANLRRLWIRLAVVAAVAVLLVPVEVVLIVRLAHALGVWR